MKEQKGETLEKGGKEGFRDSGGSPGHGLSPSHGSSNRFSLLGSLSLDPGEGSFAELARKSGSNPRYLKLLPNGDFDSEIYEDEKDWDCEGNPEDEDMPQSGVVDKRGSSDLLEERTEDNKSKKGKIESSALGILSGPAGFFKSSRGLRQGDPISPSLFILAEDYLSRLLDRLIIGWKDMMYRTGRYTMGVSHLAYADDIIIFSQAHKSAILNLMECLNHYMEVSGQKVNVGKSCYYLDKKHYSWALEISAVSGFQQGSLPFTYLGVPIFQGRKKNNLFMFLRDKISARIHSWGHRHLSFGGRLTLIKSGLGAILQKEPCDKLSK